MLLPRAGRTTKRCRRAAQGGAGVVQFRGEALTVRSTRREPYQYEQPVNVAVDSNDFSPTAPSRTLVKVARVQKFCRRRSRRVLGRSPRSRRPYYAIRG